MAIKIIITRTFKDANLKDAQAMLIQARSNAMREKGYISSETLASMDNPAKKVVLTMWQTREDWENYKNSPARQENERKYSEILEGETEYEVFNMGMG